MNPSLENSSENIDELGRKIDHCSDRIERIDAFKEQIRSNRSVNRNDAMTIKTLTTGMESMENFFEKFPVNSFTSISSKTNLSELSSALEEIAGLLIDDLGKMTSSSIIDKKDYIEKLSSLIFGDVLKWFKVCDRLIERDKACQELLVLSTMSEEAKQGIVKGVFNTSGKKWSSLTQILVDGSSIGGIQRPVEEWEKTLNKVIDCYVRVIDAVSEDGTVDKETLVSVERCLSTLSSSIFISEINNLMQMESSPDIDFDKLLSLSNRLQSFCTNEIRDGSLSFSSELSKYRKVFKEILKSSDKETLSQVDDVLGEIVNLSTTFVKFFGTLGEISDILESFQKLIKSYYQVISSRSNDEEAKVIGKLLKSI